MANKIIISASRKEDMIANLESYNQLQNILKEGIYTQNSRFDGFSNKVIDLNNIGAIVLWSKDYSNFLKNPLLLDNYNLYFQFTITGYNKIIEKGVIDTNIAIKQMEELAKRYNPNQINWRFDPIGFFNCQIENKFKSFSKERLNTFENMCKKISSFGVNRCTISFVTYYTYVKNRLESQNIKYFIPSSEQKVLFLEKLKEIATKYNIELYACSNPEMQKANIKPSSCIDGNILEKLFNIKFSKSKDNSQRSDCHCSKSIDIGNYKFCKHLCIYCYNSTI